MTLYSYDVLGNLLGVKQEGGTTDQTQWRVRSFTYDSLSRLLTATNPESGTISYSYDANGNLLQKISPAPNQQSTATQTLSFCYDALNRVTGKAYGASSCPLSSPVVTYTYDAGTNGVGHITGLTDQAGSASYSYDVLGRLSSEARTINGITKNLSYSYNLDGSIASVTYPSGATVTYTPDSAGRALSVVDAGHSINYVTGAAYGPDGQITDFISGQSSSFAGIVNSLSYNQRLQPVNIAAVSPDDPSPATNATASVTINGNLAGSDAGTVSLTVSNFIATACFGNSVNPACSGQPVNSTAAQIASSLASAINVPASPATATVNGATLSMVWKETGDVIAGVAPLASIHDQPTVFINPSFTSAATTFTGGGDGTSPNILSLSYDFHNGNGNNGNVWGIINNKDTTRNQTFTYDALNRLTSAQNAGTDCTKTTLNGGTEYWGNNYSYDGWGNLLSKTPTKCSAENLTLTATASNQLQGYGYDAAGNMTHDLTSGNNYTYDQENRITGAAGFTYTYDDVGNRVEKSTGTTGTLYWYMTPGIVAESDFAGNVQSEYVFFNGQRVARRDLSSGNVSYYFSDDLKTASVITDATGNIKSESDYNPWGGELQFANGDTNHYKLTGKERDSESGLDYFGARYYGNALARFVTPDPLLSSGTVYNPQTWNRYSYALNNPLKYLDPTGLYVCNGSKSECKDFGKALDKLKDARDSFKKGSDEYNRLDASLNAYGKAGVDNGVTVQFGATKGGTPADTEIGVHADAAGLKVVTTNNPTGQNTVVTFDTSRTGDNTGLAIAAAHEGVHVSDGAALVGALPANLASPDVAGILSGPLNLTKYAAETRAYEGSAFAAKGLGFGSLSVGNGFEIWNSGWKAADVQTLRSKGIDRELADPKGPYKVTPDAPGKKLID